MENKQVLNATASSEENQLGMSQKRTATFEETSNIVTEQEANS